DGCRPHTAANSAGEYATRFGVPASHVLALTSDDSHTVARLDKSHDQKCTVVHRNTCRMGPKFIIPRRSERDNSTGPAALCVSRLDYDAAPDNALLLDHPPGPDSRLLRSSTLSSVSTPIVGTIHLSVSANQTNLPWLSACDNNAGRAALCVSRLDYGAPAEIASPAVGRAGPGWPRLHPSNLSTASTAITGTIHLSVSACSFASSRLWKSND